jgi:hypothetical protein
LTRPEACIGVPADDETDGPWSAAVVASYHVAHLADWSVLINLDAVVVDDTVQLFSACRGHLHPCG